MDGAVLSADGGFSTQEGFRSSPYVLPKEDYELVGFVRQLLINTMAPTPCCDLAAYIRPKKPTEDQVKRQIGQTFIASFEGSICSAEVQALLQLYAVGNVLLTAENLDDVSQVIRLLQALQESARTAQQPVPLLIGIEQEGGLLQVLLKNESLRQLCTIGLAAGQSSTTTRQVGEAIGKELSAVGINWNISPVIEPVTDLTETWELSRRFGDNPSGVSNYTKAYITGLHIRGVATSATEGLSTTLREIYRRIISGDDLDKELLDHGEFGILEQLLANDLLDNIIIPTVAHGFEDSASGNEAIKFMIDKIVRDHLGFQGPVISNHSPLPSDNIKCLVHEPLRALLYGSDIVRLPIDYTTQIMSINAIYAAIESSVLSTDFIAKKSDRSVAFKSQFTSWDRSLNPSTPAAFSSLQASHKELARCTYRSSIVTLQPTVSPLLSVPDSSVILLLTPTVPQLSPRSQTSDPFEPLGRTLSRLHPRIRHVPYSLSVGLTSTHVAFLRRTNAVVMMMVCMSSALAETQDELWRSVEDVLVDIQARTNQRVVKVVIGAGDVRGFTQGEILSKGWWGVECWEYTESALETVAKVLIGETQAGGSLPLNT